MPVALRHVGASLCNPLYNLGKSGNVGGNALRVEVAVETHGDAAYQQSPPRSDRNSFGIECKETVLYVRP
jgi:hypothetical protein